MKHSSNPAHKHKKEMQQIAKAPSHPAVQPKIGGPYSDLIALQRTIGNQAVEHLLQAKFKAHLPNDRQQELGLQTKLQINEPGDSYEQEADRIAAQVMAMPERTAARSAPPRIQRFSRGAAGQPSAVPDSVHQTLASSSRHLDPATRAFFEPRFGHNFSHVRVHSGAVAEQSARDLNAHAYTVGQDIVFGAGLFVPGAQEGRRLIAHELSHVVQQGGGSRKLSEAQSSLSAAPSGYVQCQPQLPKFSQSTEEQITTLMQEHPGLSRVNAERAIIGPSGSVPTASGIPGATGTKSAKMPKVPDIKFSQPTAKGSSTVLRREVKVWEGGQASFNDTLSKAADQLEAVGGGEVLVQVPKGTDARALIQKFKGAGKLPPQAQAQRLGRYRSIRITIVDPAGNQLLPEPLEFPPSKIEPSAGGGKGIAPVAPRSQGTYGEITTGKPTGVTESGGGEGIAPVAPRAQQTHGEITVPQRGLSTPSGGAAKPVTSTGVDPEGRVLLSEPLESPPAKRLPSAGGGQRIAPEANMEEGVRVGVSRTGRFASRLLSVAEVAGPFLDAFLMLLDYKHVGIDASAFPKLSAEKLQPIVDKELQARSAEIAKVVALNPDALYGVYANVRCELRYRLVPDPTGRSLGKLQLFDVRFRGMDITARNVNKTDWNKESARPEKRETVQDMTVSILIYVPPPLPETPFKASPIYQTTDPPLYFSRSLQERSALPPQPMTIDALLRWARINHPRLLDDPNLSKEILSSSEFTGSQQARNKALGKLRRRIQEQKMLSRF